MEWEYTNTYGEETISNPLDAALDNLEVVTLAGKVNEDICSLAAALQEKKSAVKKEFIYTFSTKLLLEAILNEEQDSWPNLSKAAEKCKATSIQLKKCKAEIEDTKTTIESLCETAENAYMFLKSKKEELQKNMLCLEGKKKVLADLINQQKETESNKSAEDPEMEENRTMAVLENCQESIDKNKLHINHLEEAMRRVEDRIEIINSMNEQSQPPNCSLLMQKLQYRISTMETLGGIKVESYSSDTLQLEFTNHCESTEEQPKLILTLTFALGSFNATYLVDAKINIATLDMKELLQKAVNNNDVVYLVTELKTRWRSHLPLLSEINHLQTHYAIDWIQEESLLRLMAGRGGNVVSTLSIPTTYPVTGQITLVNIKGCAMEASQIQGNSHCNTLEEWAKYLVFKFGKP